MLIGLTGGIASGKSTVVHIFERRGIPSIDVDSIARKIVEPGSLAWEEIVKCFGNGILLADGKIDRKKLGDIIFEDSDKRRKLDEITHSKIIDEAMLRADILLKKNEFVIMDIPLLFEANIEDYFDLVIVVYIDKKEQLKRLMLRDKIGETEALFKINSQMDIHKKIKKADLIIYNNKDLSEIEKQVEIIFQDIKRGRYEKNN